MARRSAETDQSGPATVSKRKSDRFLAGLAPANRVTLVSHVNPDPDSLGSMLGLAHLIEARLEKPVRITRDGNINRAENRAMVEVLELDLVQVEDVAWAPDEAVVMVDSQPQTGRHTFPPDIPLYAVIDHHSTPGELDNVPFVDVRSGLGATCSIVTSYLLEQEVDIPATVATALLYGIETELNGVPREASALDESCLHFLHPLADKDLLCRIRNARLPATFFHCMLQALQSSFIYDKLIISWVNDMPQPELAAEVVDLLIRYEEVEWAVCGGVHNDQMILSVRSSLPRARAGDILRQAVGKLGKAGGHDRRAGGSIPLNSTAPSAIEELQGELRRRLLKALHIEECRGQRLVPLREMIQNLQA